MIRVDQLTKVYGSRVAVWRVSFEVKQGEILGFLGPNGAGKTTMIRTLLDHIRPTSGRATIFGIETTADPVAIEQELAEMWRIEAELLKQLGEGEQTLARVLLLTLAIYSPSPELAKAARDVAIAINPRQPARAIIMEVLPAAQAANGAAEPALEAWATLHCARPKDGQQQVCGEHINLEAPFEEVRRLPGALYQKS